MTTETLTKPSTPAEAVIGAASMICAGWVYGKRHPSDDDLELLADCVGKYRDASTEEERTAALAALLDAQDYDPGPPIELHVDPIPMVLHCPGCGTQHLDGPNIDEGWTNPPHRSHLCAACHVVWRPADVPTVGVAAIATRGQNDTPIGSRVVQGGVDFDWTTERGRAVSPKAVRLITRLWEMDRRVAVQRRDEIISELLQAIDNLRLQAIASEGVLQPGPVHRLSVVARRARLMRR